jgi:ATP-dependent DNA helicase RecQ
MKALEQEELLLYAGQANLPARLSFTTGKQELYRFQSENPSYTPLIEALLRTYPGIFDQPVQIFERQISRITRTHDEEVSNQLVQLDRVGLLSYQPPVNTPQIRLLQPRLRLEDLRIDYRNYLLRKEECVLRVGRMIAYLQETIQCRTQFINQYFGDTAAAPCGICDVCLGRTL